MAAHINLLSTKVKIEFSLLCQIRLLKIILLLQNIFVKHLENLHIVSVAKNVKRIAPMGVCNSKPVLFRFTTIACIA